MKKLSFLSLSLLFLISFAYAKDIQLKEKEWEANVGLNAVLNSGNSVNQTVGGTALTSRKWDKNKISWTGEGAYGRAKDNSTGVTTTNTKNWKTRLRYDRFILNPLSIFVLGHVGQDEPAGFDARYGSAMGMSHEIWKSDPNFFTYEAGFDYTRENRVALANENIYSARILLQYKRKISTWATFTQDVENLVNVEDGEDYRLNTLSSLIMKLTDKLAFKAGFGIRFDNQPVTGFKKTDTTTQAGLVVNFL